MKISNISYWNMTANKFKYPKLKNNLNVDTLIIGGGITGITSAYCLVNKGVKPILIEAENLCEGTTGNTTGKLTIQHNMIYGDILNKYGEAFAKQYANSQTSALEFIREVVNRESIDCQFTDTTSYIYASTQKEKKLLEKENDIALKVGIDSKFINNLNFPSNNLGMLAFKNQAAFHSVRYLDSLAKAAISKGAKIYCNTKAIKIEDGDTINVYCENNIIKAKHVIMATQYPLFDGPNIFFTRLFAKRAYGIAIDTKSEWPEGNYINIGNPTRSIRSHIENGKKILIIVGEEHATGREEDKMKDHYNNLIKFAESLVSVDKVIAKWSAQDYETPDKIPYIGRISNNSNIYVATGFGKWGLTSGTLAGNMLSELITAGSCHYEDLYSRTRADYSSSIGKTMTEVLGSVGELIKSKFEFTEDYQNIKQGEGKVIFFEGKKAGIYRDYDDKITILDIACTHMSTILNFNSAEKTWDCPAHGGRFATNGNLLEGPPKHSLNVLYSGQYSDFIKK